MTIAGQLLVVGSESATATALGLESGAERWTGPGPVSAPPQLTDAGLLWIGGGKMQLVDPQSGATRWSIPVSERVRQPLLMSGRVIVVDGPEVSAYRGTDGSRLWARTLGEATADPADAVDRVVVALADRSLAAVSIDSGEMVWRVKPDVAPLALAGAPDRVYYVASGGFVCAHQHADGRLDWCFAVRVPPLGAPAIGGSELAAAFLDNSLRIFDRRSGTLRRIVRSDIRPLTGPVLAGDRWLLPLLTSELFVVPRDEKQPPVRGFVLPQEPGPPLNAAAISGDGRWVALFSVTPAARTVDVYGRRPPALPSVPSIRLPPPPAPAETGGTAPGTPTTPSAPSPGR
jgi:hypothetical protein